MHSDLIYQPAAAQAAAIRQGEISSEQLADSSLERIREVNRQLNAVVQLVAEQALEDARRADDEQSHGHLRGPLHGVPMTIKDSFDTAGVVTTWGMSSRKAHIPAEDAAVVARLKQAGAILLGKTNTPELTLSYSTQNPIYGRTNNPYAVDRTPGGSSGGAAAIVAAGVSAFDIGSDTGGSIRLPAHFCGICGIRPTSGRVPRTGHAIPPGGPLDALTQVGPLARSVEDLALILPIIAGPDGVDTWTQPVPLGSMEVIPLPGRRVAYFSDNGICTPTAEVRGAVETAAQTLAAGGLIVEENRPAGLGETLDIYTDLYLSWTLPWVCRLLESEGTPRSESTIEDLDDAGSLGVVATVAAFERWEAYRRRMSAFMRGFDLLLSPVLAYPAYPHGAYADADACFSYLTSLSLLGWPVVVVPVSQTGEGLPVGVQIATQPWQEPLALAAAAYLERSLGGWKRPPL